MGLITTNFSKNIIDLLLLDLQNVNVSYYIFASFQPPFGNDNNPPAMFESYDQSIFQPTNRLVFAKKLSNSNIRYLAKRYDYTQNTIYDQYDNTDIDLKNKKFYVLNSSNRVYKCLYNNRLSYSVNEPTAVQNTAFTTADGYVWKYLFDITTSDMTNFSTANLIPVTSNTIISLTAFAGIEVVDIIAGGTNYITANGTINSINESNAQLIQIDPASSTANYYYNNSQIYIDTGPGFGQVRTINNYTVNSTGNWVELDEPFTSNTVLPFQSTYQINPGINISGDGTGANVICRVANGVISSVMIINPGNNYTHATAILSTNTLYGTGANLVPYIPPPGGHGADVTDELFSDTLGICISFNNTESNTISIDVPIRTIGIIKNPINIDGVDILSANTFDATYRFSLSSNFIIPSGGYLVGETSGSVATIVSSNTTSGYISVGDKSFIVGENVQGYYQNGTPIIHPATFGIVSQVGSYKVGTGQVLYATNVSPIQRSANTSEMFKLQIKI